MDIITRADWGARPPRRGYATIAFGSRPGMEGHHSVGTYGAGPSQPHAFARAVQANATAQEVAQAMRDTRPAKP